MFKKAKLLALAFVLALIISSVVPTALVYAEAEPAQQQLSLDQRVAKASRWAVEEVRWSAQYGLFDEELLDQFQQKINRVDAASLVVELYEKIAQTDATPVENNPFVDTDNLDVLKAHNLGIIMSDEGAFLPSDPISREEFASLLYRTIKASEPDLDLTTKFEVSYADKSKISPQALPAVTYFTENTVIKGKGNKLVAPQDATTREEAAVLVKRVYDHVIRATGRASKGLMWKVSDEDSEVHILGSIHITRADIYPLSLTIEDAYKEADYLAVEANILADNQEGMQHMEKMAVYQDDRTIRDGVSEQTYDDFNQAIQEFGFQAGQFDKLKPWYAGLLLQGLNATQSQQQGTLGPDYYFLTKAAGKKEILEIEGLQFQVDLFDGFSPELQEQFLIGTIMAVTDSESGDKQADFLAKATDEWKVGDAEGFESHFAVTRQAEDELTKDFNEKFWYQRDKHMAQKIEEYLADASQADYFIVVGAGHLITEDGIINRLARQGYTIEQVK